MHWRRRRAQANSESIHNGIELRISSADGVLFQAGCDQLHIMVKYGALGPDLYGRLASGSCQPSCLPDCHEHGWVNLLSTEGVCTVVGGEMIMPRENLELITVEARRRIWAVQYADTPGGGYDLSAP